MDKRSELLHSYLEDSLAAEKNFEGRLTEFASDCDDDDVRLAFVSQATQARERQDQLADRLSAWGGKPSSGKELLARFFAAMPAAAQLGHIQEERTVQNLIAAYTISAAGVAMYHGLQNVASAAGDPGTAAIAAAGQTDSRQWGERLLHFIPTRSIIAYNMLTIAEIDPAVETKVGEASWTG